MSERDLTKRDYREIDASFDKQRAADIAVVQAFDRFVLAVHATNDAYHAAPLDYRAFRVCEREEADAQVALRRAICRARMGGGE